MVVNISKQNTSRIAQSFYVDRDRGMYITSIDLFFQSKPLVSALQQPVYVTIRPMESGQPTASTYLSKAEKVYANIVTSTDGTAATNFRFDRPIYLDAFTFYAFTVESNSAGYNLYYSEVYEHVLNSTEKLVDKNPVTGSVFYSQNGVTWSEVQEQDLKFKIKKATWANHPKILSNDLLKVQLQNKAVPNRPLGDSPIRTDGTTTFYIRHPNHGFQEGDNVTIAGVTSGTNYVGGINIANINGTRAIKSGSGNANARDWQGYYVVAGTGAANTTLTSATGGGSGASITTNYVYTHFVPNIDVVNTNGTQVSAGIKTMTAQKNLFNSESGAYNRDAAYSQIKLNKTNRFRDTPRIVANTSMEAAHTTGNSLPNNKSLEIVAFLSTDRPADIMPMIDLERANVGLMHPAIDNPSLTVNSQDGLNRVNFPVPETSPAGGTALAKHITSIFTVEEPSVGVKVLLAANRPSVSNFDLYYRVGQIDENLREKNWTYISPDNSPPSDAVPGVFRDYEYTIGGTSGFAEEFESFQFKIVMRSSNALFYPTFRDFRAIVLID